MSESILLVEKSEGIATFTLNRPTAMNALSRELRATLAQAFSDLQNEPDIGVVILTGAGKAFSAGVDLKELGSASATRGDTEAAVVGREVVLAMAQCDRPIIGAINGVAVTGGLEVTLACDIIIASKAARFADTHARVGVLPAWGLSQRLSRVIGVYRAKEMSLTGNFLSAEQAEAWGLVNRVVTPEELMPTCRALAKDILSCVPEAVRDLKRIIDAGFATTLADGLKLEIEASRASVGRVSPEAIATRRASIQQRGRDQAS